MFSFARPRTRRRPSLTPMIDVVFLLLVFFMLVARFGADQTLPLTLAGGSEPWSGPPRLVDVLPAGQRLNGAEADMPALLAGLARLTETPDDTVVLRPRDGAVLQRVVDVMEALKGAGFARLVLVE